MRSPSRSFADLVLFGLACGLLIAVVNLVEYRFLVLEHSVEIYVVLIAVLFAGLGIWLGRTLRRKKVELVVREVPAPAPPFAPDLGRARELGITSRELEILGLMAGGLSNREIAERLFVSESTVKTHSSRLFDKLGAKRRTEAVLLGRTSHIIP